MAVFLRQPLLAVQKEEGCRTDTTKETRNRSRNSSFAGGRQADTSATVIGLRRRDLPRHQLLAENPAKSGLEACAAKRKNAELDAENAEAIAKPLQAVPGQAGGSFL